MPLPIALQLYSVREQMEEDFFGTIKEVKELGYDGVEFAGLFDRDPAVIRDFLKEIRLQPVSAHVPLAELAKDPAGTAAVYQTIGCRYIAIPYLPEELRPGTSGFAQTVEQIKSIGSVCRRMGMQLLYHNHDFEFVKIDGEYGLDMLYRLTAPEELMSELDTCWVHIGGEDPAAYVRKYTGRAPIVHLKDFYLKGSADGQPLYGLISREETPKRTAENFSFMPCGYGMQNMPELIRASQEAGAEWVVVEQDQPDAGRTPMEDARLSLDFLRPLL